MAAMDALCDDLAAESADLDQVVATADDLRTPTPAPGWSIADQLSHLWYFDERAIEALLDPDAFAAGIAELLEARADPSVERGRTLSRDELLDGWQQARAAFIAHARGLDPQQRVPWYGPPMGARSFVTARLMETWAHGQDVADAVGTTRVPTDRLRHVAHIGVGARRFSYLTRGREPNEVPVRVELASPSGEQWGWGPEDAADRITGPALDFCLVVTQRRHPDDVDLTVEGDAAREWIDIAQAFAGPPGAGRAPGESGR
jgi:uncharacterized protein (TIGR03084 family)